MRRGFDAVEGRRVGRKHARRAREKKTKQNKNDEGRGYSYERRRRKTNGCSASSRASRRASRRASLDGRKERKQGRRPSCKTRLTVRTATLEGDWSPVGRADWPRFDWKKKGGQSLGANHTMRRRSIIAAVHRRRISSVWLPVVDGESNLSTSMIFFFNTISRRHRSRPLSIIATLLPSFT